MKLIRKTLLQIAHTCSYLINGLLKMVVSERVGKKMKRAQVSRRQKKTEFIMPSHLR